VPNAVPSGDGTANLQPLGGAGKAVHLSLAVPGRQETPTSVTLFDQGLIQVLQDSITGLQAKHPYLIALAGAPDGSGTLEPIASFMTKPAGSAIVNAAGPIRQVVADDVTSSKRWLVVAENAGGTLGAIVQVL
jgi:hypothetical protein